MPRSDTHRPLDRSAALTGRRGAVGGAGFAAHLLGQAGARHGLRAGAPTITRARAAYLATQWGGAGDRRPAPGRLRRLEA